VGKARSAMPTCGEAWNRNGNNVIGDAAFHAEYGLAKLQVGTALRALPTQRIGSELRA
jgi:hypothetical protein